MEAAREALESLRGYVLAELERLDQLAARRAAEAPPNDPPDLAARARELEASWAELERRSRRVDEELARLEEDRRLLAEAWSRLERMQVEHERPQPVSTRKDRPIPLQRGQALPIENDENPVARSIIQQFQSVRRDVRRHAADRRAK